MDGLRGGQVFSGECGAPVAWGVDADDGSFLGFGDPYFRESGGLPWFCGLDGEAAGDRVAAEA